MTHTTRSSTCVVDVRLLEMFTSHQNVRDELMDKIQDIYVKLQWLLKQVIVESISMNKKPIKGEEPRSMTQLWSHSLVIQYGGLT